LQDTYLSTPEHEASIKAKGQIFKSVCPECSTASTLSVPVPVPANWPFPERDTRNWRENKMMNFTVEDLNTLIEAAERRGKEAARQEPCPDCGGFNTIDKDGKVTWKHAE
jgi:hypothetical protein